jgi:hypothetical protein
MSSESTSSTTNAGYFVIADISGYTSFVNNHDFAHAQGILTSFWSVIELLNAGARKDGTLCLPTARPGMIAFRTWSLPRPLFRNKVLPRRHQ